MVVLIIGILAAIAVPQYQKAVAKTYVASALSQVTAIYNALERYNLENNSYPDLGTTKPTAQQMNDVLDISLTPNTNMSYVFYTGNYLAIRYDNGAMRFHISKGFKDTPDVSIQQKGVITCWAYDDASTAKDVKGQEICRSVCGALTSVGSGTPYKFCVM